MKWFKHLTGSLKDPMISDLITEFGGDGYMVFFGLLDMMAEDFDVKNPGICTFSDKYIARNLQVSFKKISKILQFIETYPKEDAVKILYKIEKNKITLTCDRLKELSDSWTNKIIMNQIYDYGGVDWKITQKNIRKRDEYKCKLCGKVTKDNERSLPIHHIKPIKYFKNYKDANINENLITLCGACHVKANRGLLDNEISTIMETIWKQSGFIPDYKWKTIEVEVEEDKELKNKEDLGIDNKEGLDIKVIPPIVPQTGDGGNVKDKPKPKPRKAGIKPKYTELFNEFWNVYPRKGNKSGAFESWTIIGKAQKELGITMPEIINIVKKQISKGILNLSDDLKHCPLPVTWLNQHRWEDEESVAPQTKSKYPLL